MKAVHARYSVESSDILPPNQTNPDVTTHYHHYVFCLAHAYAAVLLHLYNHLAIAVTVIPRCVVKFSTLGVVYYTQLTRIGFVQLLCIGILYLECTRRLTYPLGNRLHAVLPLYNSRASQQFQDSLSRAYTRANSSQLQDQSITPAPGSSIWLRG
jgi:hypothetical protein